MPAPSGRLAASGSFAAVTIVHGLLSCYVLIVFNMMY